MPRPRGLLKTGGRQKGSRNKPKPEILPPGTPEAINQAEAARAVVLATNVRTPKAVILDTMVKFETIGKGLLAEADNLKTRGDPKKAAELAQEGYKFMIAAVQCAEKVAPYIHAKLVAVESRGDLTADVPFVLRAPTVMADSAAWQAAVGAAVIEREAVQVPSGGQPDQRLPPLPQTPDPAQVATPMLVADQKSGRISTMMPAGPRLVKPTGSEEWLAAVTEDRRKAAG